MKARKHWIPPVTRTDRQGRQEAVCGAMVSAAYQARLDEDVACWGCQLWLEQVARPAAMMTTTEAGRVASPAEER
jgi:hypothetical protein